MSLLFSRRSAITAVALAILALPLVHYARVAVNAPTGDDYLAILRFASDWTEATSASARWEVFADQHFSHRIWLLRAAVLGQLLIGPLNFVAFMALGWLAWFATGWCLTTSAQDHSQGSWASIAPALILAGPIGYSNQLNAMQAVCNLGVIALAFLAFHLAFRVQRPAWLAGLALGGLAAFAAANGLLVLPLIAVLLALSAQHRRAWLTAAMAAVVWLLYFTEHQRGGTLVDLAELPFTFATVGGGAIGPLFPAPLPAKCFGVVLLAAAGAAAWRTLRSQTQTAWTGQLLFVVGSLALIALNRGDWGRSYMLQDRYQLYSALLVACLLVHASGYVRLRHPAVLVPALGASATFALTSWWTTYPRVVLEHRIGTSTQLSRAYGAFAPCGDPNDRELQERELLRAERNGLFSLPAEPVFSSLPETADGKSIAISGTEPEFAGRLRTARLPEEALGATFALVLHQPRFLVPVVPVRSAVSTLLRTGELYQGAVVLLPTGPLAPSTGRWHLRLLSGPAGALQPEAFCEITP
jgi:hypothetical protein